MTKRIFISADHGMAIIYFLQSDVVPTLLKAGIEVILLTDDEIVSQLVTRFSQPGLTFEGLRLKQANDYARKVSPRWQWLLGYLRRVGGSRRINTEAMDSHIWEVWARERLEIPFGHLDSLRAGDFPPAEFCLRPQTFGADAEPLHAYPRAVY